MKMFMIYLVLGLLLFLLYIEDIKSVIKNTYCHLYANPDKKVRRELSNIDWLSINKLFHKTVRYLDTPLESKDKVKYLGVLFDKKMQWKYQIRNITNNIAPNYLSSNTLRGLIFAKTYFRDVKKIVFRVDLFSRISRFENFRENLFSRLGRFKIFREYLFSRFWLFLSFSNWIVEESTYKAVQKL